MWTAVVGSLTICGIRLYGDWSQRHLEGINRAGKQHHLVVWALTAVGGIGIDGTILRIGVRQMLNHLEHQFMIIIVFLHGGEDARKGLSGPGDEFAFKPL
jgi:hypothetical protein